MDNKRKKALRKKLTQKIKKIDRKISTTKKHLDEVCLSPEASQPLSSQPEIIRSFEEEIIRLTAEREELLTEREKLKQ